MSDPVANERPELLIFCGAAAILGSLAPTVLNVVGTIVAEHDFIADTISDLGRGPHKWIMDTGFYINAAGLIALAVAAAHLHLGRMTWSMGIFSLTFLALVTVLLGVWDKFGDTAGAERDMSVHTQLTFFLGPLYLAGPLLMADGVRRISRTAAASFVAAAVLWVVLATAFKLSPTAYDGILEKLAVLATMLWTVPLSYLILKRGLQA